MKVAYLVNQYPKVSHSFIRREILALERRGLSIQRISIRRGDAAPVDPEDRRELELTQVVLAEGVTGLARHVLRTFVASPVRFLRGLWLATQMGWRAERPMPYHWIYFFEACVVASWMNDSGAQHLHAHFGSNPTEVAMLAGLLADKPYSFTAHGTVETDHPQFIGLGEKIRRAAFVVAVSSFGRSQLYRWVEHGHWPKIGVVRCGLETAFHADCSLEPADVPRLVCVGRLCGEKGQLLLLAALRRVINAGQTCELVLAGDGEMRDEVESLRDELDLGSHVRITGWISGEQVRREIVNARALVLPSFAEGLPVVIMEAMALARPVISTYVGGIPELVKDRDTGWLVPAGDLEALVAAISSCLGAAPRQLKAMGRAGRERVLGLHDIDQQCALLADAFVQHAAPDNP